MSKWFAGLRGTVLLAVFWGLSWAPVAVVIGLIVDSDGSMDEMWPAIGAYPGFIAGALFAALLFRTARGRGFAQLSRARVTIWGALAGLVFGMFPFAVATSNPDIAPWIAGLVSVWLMTLIGAVSAAGTLALARTAERRSYS